MILFRLTWLSLLNRRNTLLLSLLSLSLSVFILLGVDMVRQQAKSSFTATVSGTDLIVGARSGQINLLLYSVFHIGNATNNISWQSYQEISQHPKVAWSIPLSLGDSHRGFRVLGTSQAYFRHFRYGRKQALEFRKGEPFADLFDVVLGAEVARQLGYKLGSEILINHGIGNAALMTHKDKPFRVVGILEATGTPVDSTLHVSLEAIEAIHLDWQGGVKMPGVSVSAEQARQASLQPEQITAMLLGLNSRLSSFQLQRAINQYRKEPLLAILPGLALQELWQMFSLAEKALLIISALVLCSSLIGLLSLMLTSLNERRREMAVLRSVGARPWQICILLMLESLLLTLCSLTLGVALVYLAMAALGPWLQAELGLHLSLQGLSLWQWQMLGIMLGLGALVGLIPGYRAYRQSLADGMAIKL
ncbi:ABC transporter permease [Neptuniibacter halophilus]|uniref:ABC transporter permease n=1 Tax=Neptuniibacter halophilus TaxID=651666 RepID=UPI0025746FE8|nr:FtsX-like permease family protein [Neptuniibacter halophilus]